MRFLRHERAVLDELLPGLDDTLTDYPWEVLERPESPAFEAFRKVGGPALLVPSEHSGTGADAVQAVRVQRAVASRSPSLAVATTMHHFSVAGLVETHRATQGLEWMLLEGVARDGLLLASGFAEGQPGRHILSPTMRAEQAQDGQILISGSKRPCSLARSMDLLTASVTVPLPDGGGTQMAVALIPADSHGLRVEPFWRTPLLAGAESEAVVLDRVPVPEDLLVRIDPGAAGGLDSLQTAGFLWFELLMTATYLGVASALAERVLRADRVPVTEQAALVVELEAVMGPSRASPTGWAPASAVRRLAGGAGVPVRRAGLHRPRRPALCGVARRDGLHQRSAGRLPGRLHPGPRLPPAVPVPHGRSPPRLLRGCGADHGVSRTHLHRPAPGYA
ncbi:acyl-CoA dehydrogenase [Streptomyces diastatochromogenes]|nr:acyl-CoA dehydrogenase [Streptomyces diastatochromogenes]